MYYSTSILFAVFRNLWCIYYLYFTSKYAALHMSYFASSTQKSTTEWFHMRQMKLWLCSTIKPSVPDKTSTQEDHVCCMCGPRGCIWLAKQTSSLAIAAVHWCASEKSLASWQLVFFIFHIPRPECILAPDTFDGVMDWILTILSLAQFQVSLWVLTASLNSTM